jgi:hypothetical protein
VGRRLASSARPAHLHDDGPAVGVEERGDFLDDQSDDALHLPFPDGVVTTKTADVVQMAKPAHDIHNIPLTLGRAGGQAEVARLTRWGALQSSTRHKSARTTPQELAVIPHPHSPSSAGFVISYIGANPTPPPPPPTAIAASPLRQKAGVGHEGNATPWQHTHRSVTVRSLACAV